MTTYISLLRGINVGGHKKILMKDLKTLCESLGLQDVQTYIQSGNVLFKALEEDADKLNHKLERKIAQVYGFSVTCFTLSARALRKIIKDNPFDQKGSSDDAKLLVTFLSSKPKKESLRKLDQIKGDSDEFTLIGHVLFLYCPNGYRQTKLSHPTVERKLSLHATTRNWRTVKRLDEMATALSS